jgi:hypothetical protein
MPEPPKLPPVAAAPLSVVLLAHTGGPPTEPVLAAWLDYLKGLGRDFQLILAVAGAAEAPAVTESLPGVEVLHVPEVGEGAALRAALAVARHPLLFYTLCDFRYQPADLGLLLHKRHLPDKPELEIDLVHLLSGYRAGRRVPWPLRLTGLMWRIFSRVVFSYAPPRLPGWLGWRAYAGRQLVRALMGVRYHDVACPFRLIRREIFTRIPLQSAGPFVHVEILAKANFLGHVLGETEVPLPAGHHPPVGEPRPGGTWRQMWVEFRRVLTNPDFGSAAPLPDLSGKGE